MTKLTRSAVEKRNDRMFAMFDRSWVLKAIAAGWYLDERLNKWRHKNSSAVYCNTERWARYACEDHNIA